MADNGRAAFDYFVGQGLAPHQAAGIVGNLQGESGQGLNPLAMAPGDGRDGSDSIGIAQWNGTRAQALKDYAESKGVPWTDLTTQLQFLHSELQGPEAAAYKKVLSATTPEDAGRAFLAFERPKNWNQDGAYPDRLKSAVAAYSRYGGQPQPVASAPQQAPQGLIPSPPTQQQAPQAAAAAQPADTLAGQLAAMPIQAPPIFYAQPEAPDLSRLRADLQGHRAAPIFVSRPAARG
jgi:hypothetical protein